jgi:hypothetical protein
MHLSLHRSPIRKCTINAESKVWCMILMKVIQSVLALFKGRRVSLTAALRLGECCPPRALKPRAVLEPIARVCMNIHVKIHG